MALPTISVPSATVNSKDLISSSISEIRSEIGTLCRLGLLDQALGMRREPIRRHVIAIWEEVQKAITESRPWDQVKMDAAASIKKYPQIYKLYGSELDSISNEKELSHLAGRFLAEANAIKEPPFAKTMRGIKGPTILTSHLPSEPVMHPRPIESVLKWTDWTEIGCNRIYDIFSRCVAKADVSQYGHGFEVPASAGIDLHTLIHELPSGRRIKIDAAAKNDLEASLTGIMDNLGLKPDFTKQLMVSRRIRGSTLIDFAHTKYQFLKPDQRKKLFERLGRIIVLDLLTGTFDRLAEIRFDQNQYILDDFESNLGNVMVEDDAVFAIDNGCEQELVDDAERKRQYLDFLTQIFRTQDFDLLLSKKTVASFQSACNLNSDDDSASNVTELKKEFHPFLADLELIGLPAIRRGIHEMAHHLINDMSEKLRELSSLRDHYPALVAAVQERMEHFAKIMEKS